VRDSREATVNSAEDAMPKLFASAASSANIVDLKGLDGKFCG
jgi:hypothetical protein